MKTQIEIGIEGSVLSTVGTHTYCELKLEEISSIVSFKHHRGGHHM